MRTLLLLASFVFLMACSHQSSDIGFGIQPKHASFVPARIAILKCRAWPAGARFKDLPLTNFNKKEQQNLCKKFDSFVLSGFDGQPYMRGISPKAVSNALKRQKGARFLGQLDTLWQHKEKDCEVCDNPPAFYTLSISDREKWRLWLTELSRATKNADAVLLPMVTYGFARTFDDRGIQATQKVAGISLFLIDTNSGYLLWAGGREAEASNQVLVEKKSAKKPKPPKWERLYSRLFIDDLWREFPGRQVYH